MSFLPLKVTRRDSDAVLGADGDTQQLYNNAIGRLKVSVSPAAYSAVVGTITTSTSTVVADVSRAGAATIMVAGTYTGVNFTFEASVDGTTFVAFPVQPISLTNTLVTATGVIASQTLAWDATPLLGVTSIRVRATAYTSGTANITITPSATAVENAVQVNGTVAVTQSTSPWVTREAVATTPTVVQVTPSATSVTIKALNANRKAIILYNGGTSDCYVAYGATSSLTAFTFILPSLGTTTIRGEEYSGVISGIWTAAGGLSMQVTETV